MKRTYRSLPIMGLLGAMLLSARLIGRTSGEGPGYSLQEPIALASVASQLRLTGVQLLFRGQPADQLINGEKIKKYSLEVTGTGFLPGSSVVVNSVRAYPMTIGEPPLQAVSTSYISPTNLEAVFLPGKGPAPGLLTIKVVNIDTTESNIINVDVISKPAKLSIASISPQSGPVGTPVTLTGVGFAPAGSPSQVAIRFSAVGTNQNFLEGFYTDSNLDSGKLNLVVPRNVILPICPGGPVVCDPIAVPFVTPQQYRVWVVNPNGMSNGILFTVTSS